MKYSEKNIKGLQLYYFYDIIIKKKGNDILPRKENPEPLIIKLMMSAKIF